MNKQDRGAEAEPIARECLEIRRKIMPPGQWQIYGALSAVGESLLTQKKYAEAEPLLLEAHAEMLKRTPTPITAPFTASIARTVSGLVDLYTATSEPAKAAVWQQKLAPQKSAAP
jgi:eukaryotic-like serine/threonine-protein kinase